MENIYSFLVHILNSAWNMLNEMSPYLLFGFFVAGLLSVLIPQRIVEKHLGGSGIWPVIKASILGVPLPLCSCGVIPVATSLRLNKASKASVVSFLISTPQTGVDSIFVTYSMLGIVFAVFRPIAAFINGIIGGAMVLLFDKDKTDKKDNVKTECDGSCGLNEKKGNRFISAMKYGFGTLPEDISKALLVGILIAGVISAIVPDDFFASVIGTGLLSMFVMLLVGIPLYVCATASVPIAAVLIMKGISPGAALVFLMTGPATNAATIATIWKVMGKKTSIIYLITVAFTAIFSGLILDYLFKITNVTHVHASHEMLPAYLKTIMSVILLGILIKPFVVRKKDKTDTAGKIVIEIDGMHCNQCVNSISKVLSGEKGVVEVNVDLKAGKAFIKGENVDETSIKKAIESLGYKVKSFRR